MIRPILALVLALLVAACSVGPSTIPRDRFNYSEAISDSWKDQMLLNIVKMRYGDVPVFVEVASIVGQYEVKGELTSEYISGGLASPRVTAQGTYSDRPTISYNPLSGEKFVKSLMTPIDPAMVLHFIEVGWPVDFILGLTVQTINGIYNRAGGQMSPHPADPQFYRLCELLRSIQMSGDMGFRTERQDDGTVEIVLYFRHRPDGAGREELDEVRSLLRLAPDALEFKLTNGACPMDENEVAIMSRSTLQILDTMAGQIGVPDADRANGLVSQASGPETGPAAKPLIAVRAVDGKPAGAFVAVRYRRHWFWIDERDFASKRAFSFLLLVMTRLESGGANDSPVLTLSAGG